MKRYRDWSPTPSDVRGLNAEDRQEWFVLQTMRTRDSGCLDESNFASALKILGGESDTCAVARFGHWGPGWFEIILLAPERESEGLAIEESLDGYPILDESDFSERESESEFECWPAYGCYNMINMLQKNFELFGPTVDFLKSLDDSSNGLLRKLHYAHSAHDHEMDDQGASYDFAYIDPRYHYWPEHMRMSRHQLANFLMLARREVRAARAVAETREWVAP